MSRSTEAIPPDALRALQDAASLPICTACGTQYSAPRDNCVICDDPRQAVPPTGQTWTTLAELSTTHTVSVNPDHADPRISTITVDPPFAINQSPFLFTTAHGSYIWDCAATITPSLVSHLRSLKVALRAMAISHPHFFSTSLTWHRALGVPLYICKADEEWYQRRGEIKEGDDVRWWTGEEVLGEGVKVIQCGGHFPGSSVLFWDRLQEPAPDPLSTQQTPVSGILLVADTVFVQPTQKGFTFIWSVPNLPWCRRRAPRSPKIPLNPKDTLSILRKLEPLPFNEAASQWSHRWIRNGAKHALRESAIKHLRAMGWKMEGEGYVPLEEA